MDSEDKPNPTDAHISSAAELLAVLDRLCDEPAVIGRLRSLHAAIQQSREAQDQALSAVEQAAARIAEVARAEEALLAHRSEASAQEAVTSQALASLSVELDRRRAEVEASTQAADADAARLREEMSSWNEQMNIEHARLRAEIEETRKLASQELAEAQKARTEIESRLARLKDAMAFE